MDTKVDSSRRKFLAGVAGAGAMAKVSNLLSSEQESRKPSGRLPIVYFSKHLQWLDWEQMAETAAELGFDGIDLTVRQGGHVAPENAKRDLPKVEKIVRKAGLEIPMITAGIVDADSPNAEAIIGAAGDSGISRYRWGWFSWTEDKKVPDLSNFSASIGRPSGLLVDVPNRLAQLKGRVAKLAALNDRHKVRAMYHNHSGGMVGASLWDLWMLIKDFDTRSVGSNFDIAHATVEGGLSGWVTSTRLMAPFMGGLAIKDFKWGKNAQGNWEPLWCPLGEGMVNFPAYFAMIKESNFSGPVQLHTEYSLGGVETGAKTLTMDKKDVLVAIRRDLNTLKNWMRQAQLI